MKTKKMAGHMPGNSYNVYGVLSGLRGKWTQSLKSSFT